MERIQYSIKIAHLIRLHQEQKLGGEESEELRAWLEAEKAHADLMAEWEQSDAVDSFIDMYVSATDAETAFETRIAPRLLGKESTQRQYRGYWMTGIAASVVAAALVTSLWFYNRNGNGKNTNPVTASTTTHPGQPVVPSGNGAVLPGRERATLRLENGNELALDAQPNGIITQQEGTTIVKNKPGVLTYEAPTSQGAHAFNTVLTPRGGTYRVELPDGTVAWLNAASTLRFPVAFGPDQRKVTLSGEAYFEVAPNPKAPFIVNVDHTNTDIRVLGTQFDVLAYEEEPNCKTTVLEGSVRVTAGTGASGTLQKNEEALASKDGAVKVVANKDAKDAIAWTNDRLVLNRNLTEILRDVSRWYDVDVQYQGKIEDRVIGGSVAPNSSLADVLTVLSAAGNVHFTVEKRRIQVTP
jgi:ferric-dicitrate binding protein FerR (iron transport regulator)